VIFIFSRITYHDKSSTPEALNLTTTLTLEQLPMQAVILAAGKGSRLNPITLNRTKAMVPILGKPIVERVMEGLAQNGIQDFILVVSREDSEVTRYFQEQSTLKVKLQFVIAWPRPICATALSFPPATT
jgi:CTP:molybdopterin cytidylyltransferase MocA